MVRVEEANLSQAMKFAFDNFVKQYDTDNILDYRPVSQKDESWLRDNPSNGVIFIKDHPNAKEAWIIVKFEQTKKNQFGQHAVYGNSEKITTPQQFQSFFGVYPAIDWPDDMTVYVKWDKSVEVNKYAYRDFDETTPNFYMYINHSKNNIETLVKRIYKINEIIENDPKAIVGNVFSVPRSATNIK